MTDKPIDLHIVLPLISGGSGGLVKGLVELVPRWKASPRVGEVVIHLPKAMLPEIDRLGVDVRRFPVNHMRPIMQRLAPTVVGSQARAIFAFTARPVRVPALPLVTMVRNVEPIQKACYRMPPLWRLRLWALRRDTLRACREATRVVAVSHYVKERLLSYGVPSSKVDVVYHSAGPETEPAQRPHTCASIAGPFIFTAGSIVPYRGFEDLIRAVAILKARGGEIPTLVIAGSGGGLARPYERWVRALPMVLGVGEHTVWAGQLARPEMTWCFRHAAAVVQTSRAESFSIFQLEAMYAGASIISCTQAPMPEILGDAADYYVTGDPDDLARALSQIMLARADEVAARKAVALSRASMFSWDREAEQTLDSLEAAREDFARARRERA